MKTTYKVYFLERDSLEDASEYEAFEPYYAVKDFLKDTYDNCDGWEWMRNDNGSTIVRTVAEDGTIVDYSWELEFEPSFYILEQSK